MSAEGSRKRAPAKIRFALITVSDTRTEADDAGGEAARRGLELPGQREPAALVALLGEGRLPAQPRALRDEVDAAAQVVRALADPAPALKSMIAFVRARVPWSGPLDLLYPYVYPTPLAKAACALALAPIVALAMIATGWFM
jgi:hypothetical protein